MSTDAFNFLISPLDAPLPQRLDLEPAWTPADWAAWEASHNAADDAARLVPGSLVGPAPIHPDDEIGAAA